MKISGVKRSQHIKHKKNYPRPGKKKEAAKKVTKNTEKALATSKRVFGKPIGQKKEKKKDGKLYGVQNGTDSTPSKGASKSKKPQKDTKQQNGHAENENGTDYDETDMQDLMDMIDEDDDLVSGYGKASNKRKRGANDVDDESTATQFEQEYAHNRNEEKSKKMRTVDLLPIKTKSGDLITRTTEVEVKERPKEVAEPEDDEAEQEDEEVVDSDDDIVNDTQATAENLKTGASKAISTADLLILRDQEIARQKYRIGIICTGILEKPEDKMKNFNALFDLMAERHNDTVNLLTVRKIAAMSMLEVFKDILPEYRVGQIDLKTQKG